LASATPIRCEGIALIEGARHAQAQRQRPARVDGEVGQHRPHQRLVYQPPLEGGAAAGPADRLVKRGAHQPAGAIAVSSLVWWTIGMMVRTPAPPSPI